MSEVNCPSCRGRGKVSAEEAVRIYEDRERTGISESAARRWQGATCSCDGPPHTYDPVRPDPSRPGGNTGWCPPSGPVTHRR